MLQEYLDLQVFLRKFHDKVIFRALVLCLEHGFCFLNIQPVY